MSYATACGGGPCPSGCERRTGLIAHHIAWWGRDLGPTDLDNLVGLCPVHHRLVHGSGWDVRLEDDGFTWLRPDGTRYRSGPPPPEEAPPEPKRADPEVLRRLFFETASPDKITTQVKLSMLRGDFTTMVKELARTG